MRRAFEKVNRRFVEFIMGACRRQKHGGLSRIHLNRNSRPERTTIFATALKANVKTCTHPKSGKAKTCTAHDLRRSFGTRRASLVMPAVLQQRMRHTRIQTTMAFYVTRNAVTAGDVIREAVKNARSGNLAPIS